VCARKKSKEWGRLNKLQTWRQSAVFREKNPINKRVILIIKRERVNANAAVDFHTAHYFALITARHFYCMRRSSFFSFFYILFASQMKFLVAGTKAA